MRPSRGFTLIELVVVSALIAILAVAAVVTMRAARRNADVGAVAFQVAMKLQGKRTEALTQQQDRVVVFVDAPGNDASGCSGFSPSSCMRVFYLRQPAAAWTLADFDPDHLDADDALDPHDGSESLPKGVRFYLPATGSAAPKPFGNPTDPSKGVRVFDSDRTGTCGSRTCFAIRFSADGSVEAEKTTTSEASKRGYAFGIGSELTSTSNAADKKGVVIAFPTGIVKTFSL